MLFGHTPGGSPIYFNTGRSSRKPGKKRMLFDCSNPSCVHRATRNQAKISGGRCTHCWSWLAAFEPQMASSTAGGQR